MRLRTLILFCLAIGVAAAASIDGAWTSEMKMRGGKKGGGQDRTVQISMSLKAEGSNLTGTVSKDQIKGTLNGSGLVSIAVTLDKQ